MEVIPFGTEVLISAAGSYHNGDVGTVISHGQQSASSVKVGECQHVFHNSELRPIPEQDTIPAPVEL